MVQHLLQSAACQHALIPLAWSLYHSHRTSQFIGIESGYNAVDEITGCLVSPLHAALVLTMLDSQDARHMSRRSVPWRFKHVNEIDISSCLLHERAEVGKHVLKKAKAPRAIAGKDLTSQGDNGSIVDCHQICTYTMWARSSACGAY